MSDEATLNKNEIALSGRRALALQSSGLVKRGLELIPVLKKPHLRVLIAEYGAGLLGILSEIVKAGAGEAYDVDIASISPPYSDQILQLHERDAFDIAILLLNNIRFSDLPSTQNRQERSVAFITQMMAIRRQS